MSEIWLRYDVETPTEKHAGKISHGHVLDEGQNAITDREQLCRDPACTGVLFMTQFLMYLKHCRYPYAAGRPKELRDPEPKRKTRR
jgi:hypothetical protein